MADFVHLHVHTQYSLLDGLNRSDKLFEKVKNNGMDAVAITDHGVLYGVAEFWKMSKNFNVKPIIGCEMYLAPKDMASRTDIDGIRYYHLLLIAKNDIGYKNLIKLVTKSHLDGMYYKPRVDLDLLKKHSEGLICTSACLAGPLSRHIARDEEKKAKSWLEQLHGLFKNDFYLEIQRNGIRAHDEIDFNLINSLPKLEQEDHLKTLELQVKVNKKLYDFSQEYNIPIVATTDAHFLNSSDRDAQKILFCIRDGKTIDDPTGLNGYVETHIKTPLELKKDFSDIPEVLEETLKINEKIEEINLKPDRVQPKYWNIPKGSTPKKELEEQVFQGAFNKYGNTNKEKLPGDIVNRLNHELMVIDKMGYNNYFLVVGDLMKFARENEIIIGVRGSAAGSLVSYCLEITNVDPIKWGLVFERFLNLERASPPDIDMDIQDDRRQEVIDYAKEKYGENSVAGIITFGRLATKAAIRDVARVMGIEISTADRLSKMVTVLFGKPFTFNKMMDTNKEFKAMVESDPRLQKLGKVVENIEGLNRHTGVHAAGYLITPGPIDNYMAYQRDQKDPNLLVTQMDGNWIDKLDFMKFDFLGLRTLTILKDCIKYIEKNRGKKIDLSKVNIDPDDDSKNYDAKAFKVFKNGETIGVFQFESPPMKKYLIDLQPTTLSDICFLAAAYRPGPMEYISDYIKIKNGEKKVEYLIPELEPILKSTLGFPVYQEQLLEICMQFGGFTLGEGDVIRNALKKKELHILKEKEADFKNYFVKHYPHYGEKIAIKIWNQLEPFASYGFNKAHAASYAAVAYWCAYLKGNYPLEFITALMHSDLESAERIITDINEVRRLGYNILPLNINKSDIYFNPEGSKGIRFGLGGIKNVGKKVCKKIISERNKNGLFKNLDDLISRVGTKNLNKRVVESLIKSGALDDFGERNGLLAIMQEVFDKVIKAEKANEIGQAGLFSYNNEHDGINELEKTNIPDFIKKASDKEKVEWEKELLGIYISTHPLHNFSWVYLLDSFVKISELEQMKIGSKIKILGVFNDIKIIRTKAKNEQMAILKIEDIDASFQGVIFPNVYSQLKTLDLVQTAKPYVIVGTLNERNDQKSIIIEKIDLIESYKLPKSIQLDLSNIKEKEVLLELKKCFSSEKSDNNIRLIIKYGSRKKTIKRSINIMDKNALNVVSKFI